MSFLNHTPRKIALFLNAILLLLFLTSCGGGFLKPVDPNVSANSKERVKKNLEEGRGISLGKMMGGSSSGGTNYEFASSNPMWRATLEILDFLPLTNVDYSGGIITTDWYNEGTALDESIKITVRFLTNEIRSDGIKVIVHNKKCSVEQSCKITKISSAIQEELQVAILKKAIIFEKEINKKQKKYKRQNPK